MTLPDSATSLKPGNKIVVFVHRLNSKLSDAELETYRQMDEATLDAAKRIDGYLGHECASSEEGTVFMSYWRDDEAVMAWARDPLHREAKEMGRSVFYAQYRTMVCTVERHHLSD